MATPGIVHRPPKRAEVEVSSTLEPRALKLTFSRHCYCAATRLVPASTSQPYQIGPRQTTSFPLIPLCSLCLCGSFSPTLRVSPVKPNFGIFLFTPVILSTFIDKINLLTQASPSNFRYLFSLLIE